jgi:hypothetical protein
MTWFAVIESATGVLVSEGTVLADPMPAHLEAIELADRINWLVERWDAATRTVVPKPAPLPDVDRVEEFIARVPILSTRLNVTQLTEFRTQLGRLLGPHRLRDASETTDLTR